MTPTELLEKASTLKIAVVGDFIEDRYITGDVTRISPEAPIQILHKRDMYSTPGGAGNVFMNLANLGVKAHLYCFTHDPYSLNKTLPEQYDGMWSHHNSVHSIKTRVVCGNHQLLRIDEELRDDEREWLTFQQIDWWKNGLEEHFGEYDAIILVDYHKGVLSDSLINAIMELSIYHSIPVIVDAKRDYHRYKGATIIKCNQKEYDQMPRWNEKYADYLVVTDGERGIKYLTDGVWRTVSAPKIDIIDVCGAGDTATAMLALVYSLKGGMNSATEYANIAASEVCRHPGVYAITKEDLIIRSAEVGYGK